MGKGKQSLQDLIDLLKIKFTKLFCNKFNAFFDINVKSLFKNNRLKLILIFQ